MTTTTKILVVDDIGSVRLALGKILEDEGYSVAMAGNGYQAIAAAQRDHFDVVFIDINLSGISGVQTLREIRRAAPAAMPVMTAASSRGDLVREAVREGARAVVYQPFSREYIVSVIEAVLRQTSVLVVDDTFADSETLRAMLEESGYQVAVVRSGDTALSCIAENHPDIVFLSAALPDADCVDLCGEIKKRHPEVAIVIMAGYSDAMTVNRAAACGAGACIYKPFNTARILALTGDIARQRREKPAAVPGGKSR